MDHKAAVTFQSRKDEVVNNFNEFSTRNLYSIIEPEQVESTDRLAISTVCWRPELKPLLSDVKFSVRNIDTNAFILMHDEIIAIDSKTLQCPAPSAFYLRHALELLALRSCQGKVASPIDHITLAIAAFRTALQYLDNMIDLERNAVLATLPDWIKQVATKVSLCKQSHDAGYKSLQVISTAIENLLPLQEQAYPLDTSNFTNSDIELAINRALILLPLLNPTEQILTMGGDNRLMSPLRGDIVQDE